MEGRIIYMYRNWQGVHVKDFLKYSRGYAVLFVMGKRNVLACPSLLYKNDLTYILFFSRI
jgi:hypothetical protein